MSKLRLIVVALVVGAFSSACGSASVPTTPTTPVAVQLRSVSVTFNGVFPAGVTPTTKVTLFVDGLDKWDKIRSGELTTRFVDGKWETYTFGELRADRPIYAHVAEAWARGTELNPCVVDGNRCVFPPQ